MEQPQGEPDQNDENVPQTDSTNSPADNGDKTPLTVAKTVRRGTPKPRTQLSYDRTFNKFIQDAKSLRSSGYIRLIEDKHKALTKGPSKRVARGLLDQFEKNEEPEDYMYSSKLAVAGLYDNIIEYLEGNFHQKISDDQAEDLFGFSSNDFPILSHNEDYGEYDDQTIETFRKLFEKTDLGLPDFNVFNIIQIRDKLRGTKIDESDKAGFQSKKRGSFFKRLRKLNEKNDTLIAEGNKEDIRFFRLSGIANGANPTIVKILPNSRLANSPRLETEITVGDEKITMYLLLGSFADNKAFLKQLATELKINVDSFDDTLEAMKRAAKIKRAPKPSEVAKDVTPPKGKRGSKTAPKATKKSGKKTVPKKATGKKTAPKTVPKNLNKRNPPPSLRGSLTPLGRGRGSGRGRGRGRSRGTSGGDVEKINPSDLLLDESKRRSRSPDPVPTPQKKAAESQNKAAESQKKANESSSPVERPQSPREKMEPSPQKEIALKGLKGQKRGRKPVKEEVTPSEVVKVQPEIKEEPKAEEVPEVKTINNPARNVKKGRPRGKANLPAEPGPTDLD